MMFASSCHKKIRKGERGSKEGERERRKEKEKEKLYS